MKTFCVVLSIFVLATAYQETESEILQLYYYPFRGRLEAVRLFLVDAGLSPQYYIIPIHDAWTNKYKRIMIFGHHPRLVEQGFELYISTAILKYLGRQIGIGTIESDIKLEAKLDMINIYVDEIRVAYEEMIYHNYEAGKDEYIKGLPEKFRPLEIVLKKWNNQYILPQITYVDYDLFDILDIHLILAPDCLSKYPTLQRFYNNMANRPKIKAYRDSDGFKKRPVNGNGKQ